MLPSNYNSHNKTAQDEVKAPKEPHLAVLIDDGTGPAMVALQVGTMIAIVTDPTKVDGVIPLVLAKVTKEHVDFFAYTRNRASTRAVRFKADWQGKYKGLMNYHSGNSKEALDKVSEAYGGQGGGSRGK